MADVLISNYNNTVTDKDICFFLGDLAIKRNVSFQPEIAEVFKSLKGKKHLVLGNHDYFYEDFYLNDCDFLSVNKRIVTDNYVMVHNPTDKSVGNFVLSNKIILHGHIHSEVPVVTFREPHTGLNIQETYDVGVDANNFTPVAMRCIKKFIYGESKK
jgi:calcineurin-like phosphoesterase family protein